MVSRRDLLRLGGGLAAVALVPCGRALAEGPKRGGTLTIRAWDPPHFDPALTRAFETHVPLSFTHSRLLKHRAGPGVTPGSFTLEGDLAESWLQTGEATYVFRLRRGVRFHNKPPVNGRELTADDVVYTVNRILTVEDSASGAMLSAVDKAEALDRYTVKFSLRAPFAWFLDMVADPMTVAIVARECVERYGDLKRPEAVIGTGPWELESYRPGMGISLVRNPAYFVAGLPYIDRVELVVDEDHASRVTAFLSGKYDLGWEFPGTIDRTDWEQIRDTLGRWRPGLQTADVTSNAVNVIQMRTDRPPFADVRVRQAVSMAIDRQAIVDATLGGVGMINGPLPAALVDWALPVDRIGEGARFYRYSPGEARRLLAAAGLANGLPAGICVAAADATRLADTLALVLRNLKDVGIVATLDERESAAQAETCAADTYDSMGFGSVQPFLEPDDYLYRLYYPGSAGNGSHVNDATLNDLLNRQRRTFDPRLRRELLYAIQRHLARRQYYIHMPSRVLLAVWDGALQNYAPNLGPDYGGRLMGVWLDR